MMLWIWCWLLSNTEILGFICIQRTDCNNFDLALAIKDLAKANNKIKIIGTRHGEKIYEMLCTHEEMVKAEGMFDFYRTPADNRDLNYAMYFSEGVQDISMVEDFHSPNSFLLDAAGVKELIPNLGYFKKELLGHEIDEFLV